ncbi:hypothetical protein BPAE_0037g00500 [Botrytis paeoniae]|uniref:Uncharacterized protein n=1 Tax=Botrytis paeoniae TaxID=278948 RepID=A0A4Z1FTD1_9HELO|nr:hypothetical protein BPAE_0037g00500 [Botrytis paeoniae]
MADLISYDAKAIGGFGKDDMPVKCRFKLILSAYAAITLYSAVRNVKPCLDSIDMEWV